MRVDHQCLMAALLHDVIEDTGVPSNSVDNFDDQVAELVDGVSKLSSMFLSEPSASREFSKNDPGHGQGHSGHLGQVS